MKNNKTITMMKNIKLYILKSLVVMLLVIPSGCDKDFLDEDLRDGLSPKVFFNKSK
jgi:hypothetical protein